MILHFSHHREHSGNTPVKRVKTGAGALPDVDEGSTSSHRRPSREVTASYDSNEPSDASRPDAKKRNKGNNKNIDLDYTHKKRKQETSTFAPNKKRRTETSQESFPCPTCGEVIGRFFDLKRHMKTHTGDKLPCPVTGCSNVFSRQDAVVRHVKGKHKPKTSLRHRADENGDLETDEAQNTECDVDDDEEDDKEEAEVRKAQKSCPKPKKGGKRKRK
ncbi:hypothetical protein BDZ89DRAFT_355779 [Hymenopellis radicata]|nr:hypothetical protein BDZ89DRAFT_355779 [Hymenopellis radicata]